MKWLLNPIEQVPRHSSVDPIRSTRCVSLLYDQTSFVIQKLSKSPLTHDLIKAIVHLFLFKEYRTRIRVIVWSLKLKHNKNFKICVRYARKVKPLQMLIPCERIKNLSYTAKYHLISKYLAWYIDILMKVGYASLKILNIESIFPS